MKQFIGHPQYIKEVNLNIVKDIINEKGPVSKPELSKITCLSLPTINKIVDELEMSGKVKATGTYGSGVGRKAQLYVVNENSEYILALYFKNDFYICSVVNAIGEIIYKIIMPVDTSTKDSALDSTYDAIDNLLEHAENKAKAIGIGVPGVVKNNNVLSNITNIPEWEGINLKEMIRQKYGIKTYVENDVKLTTVGFYHNKLKQQYDDIVYMYLGKGIGSGIIINKKLYKGYSNFSGEWGYMIVEKSSKEDSLDIKTRGLLEKKASNIVKDIKNAVTEEETKIESQKLIDIIAYSVNNLICILNPQVIVLSGEVVDEQFIIKLHNKVEELIAHENMPIFMNDNCETSGIFGIVNMCISNISSKFQLVKEKGV